MACCVWVNYSAISETGVVSRLTYKAVKAKPSILTTDRKGKGSPFTDSNSNSNSLFLDRGWPSLCPVFSAHRSKAVTLAKKCIRVLCKCNFWWSHPLLLVWLVDHTIFASHSLAYLVMRVGNSREFGNGALAPLPTRYKVHNSRKYLQESIAMSQYAILKVAQYSVTLEL